MSIGFTDMTDGTEGVDLNVSRFYGSKNKAVNGDFNYDWNLVLNTINLYGSCPMDIGFQCVKSGNLLNAMYSIEETIPHYVYVSYGNGKSDIFKIGLYEDLRKQSFMSSGQATIIVEKVSDGTNELSFVCSKNVNVHYIGQGDIPLFVNYDGSLFDIKDCIIKTHNRAQYIISFDNGLKGITNIYGNKITVNKNRYKSSTGGGINFVRDDMYSITSITDTNGDLMTNIFVPSFMLGCSLIVG